MPSWSSTPKDIFNRWHSTSSRNLAIHISKLSRQSLEATNVSIIIFNILYTIMGRDLKSKLSLNVIELINKLLVSLCSSRSILNLLYRIVRGKNTCRKTWLVLFPVGICEIASGWETREEDIVFALAIVLRCNTANHAFFTMIGRNSITKSSCLHNMIATTYIVGIDNSKILAIIRSNKGTSNNLTFAFSHIYNSPFVIYFNRVRASSFRRPNPSIQFY